MKRIAFAVMLTTIASTAFAWEWPLMGKSKEQAKMEAVANAAVDRECGQHPEIRALNGVNDAQIKRQLDADIKELEGSMESPAARERYQIRQAIKKARAERLEAEWMECAQRVYERSMQSQSKK